ncbi:MAG: hypothetical protein WCF25_03480 [Acidimicrobiales bacterium]
MLLEVYWMPDGSPEYFSVREHDGVWGQGVPVPTDLARKGYDLIYGLSCESDADCTAVGYKAVATGIFESLIEQYQDGHWLPAQLVSPGGTADTSSGLDVVTCTGFRCTAGGFATFDGKRSGLIVNFTSRS